MSVFTPASFATRPQSCAFIWFVPGFWTGNEQSNTATFVLRHSSTRFDEYCASPEYAKVRPPCSTRYPKHRSFGVCVMYFVIIVVFPMVTLVSPRFRIPTGNGVGVNAGNVRRMLPNMRRVPVGPNIVIPCRGEDIGDIFAVITASKKNGMKSAT